MAMAVVSLLMTGLVPVLWFPVTDGQQQLSELGFDLVFLNQTYHRMVTIYDAENGDDHCDLDNLAERLLPADYQVDQNFNLTTAKRTETVRQSLEVLHRLLDVGANMSQQLNPLIGRIVRQFSFLAYEIQLTPQCMASVVRITRAIRSNQLWALKFLDAMGKPPSGILEGTLSGPGDYGQCLNIREPEVGLKDRQRPIRGKYCLARPIIPHADRKSIANGEDGRRTPIQNIPDKLLDEIGDILHLFNGSFISFGLCLPNDCSAAEIEHAINSVLYPITGIPVEIGPESTCHEDGKSIPLDRYQMVAISIFVTLTVVCTSASILYVYLDLDNDTGGGTGNGCSVDQTKYKPSSMAAKLIGAVSLVHNTRLMFRPRPNKFESVDFFRLLMLLLTIVMHQYYVAIGWSTWPFHRHLVTGLLFRVASESRYWFLRNTHCTDFFFALNGLLLAYSMLGTLDRYNGRFNYVQFVLNIYLRFYPAVFGVILMYYLLPLLGDGPFWHRLDPYHVHSCRENLIPSLLSYNFYLIDLDEFIQHSMCNVASWWVNTCFHLILLSPAITLPLYWCRTSTSVALLLATIIAGSAASVGHILWTDIPYMTHIARMDRILEESFQSIFYTWPFIHHIGPFVLGILTGYLIKRHPKIYLGGQWGETMLSVAFIGMTALATHWTQAMLRSDETAILAATEPITIYEVFLNITAGKLMFCAGFLWLFYLCTTNRAPRLNHWFTWPWLQPLYSLSLGIYLTNFIPPLWMWFHTRHLIEFTDFFLMTNLAFNLAATIGLAYLIHVLFEKPVVNLLKILQS